MHALCSHEIFCKYCEFYFCVNGNLKKMNDESCEFYKCMDVKWNNWMHCMTWLPFTDGSYELTIIWAWSLYPLAIVTSVTIHEWRSQLPASLVVWIIWGRTRSSHWRWLDMYLIGALVLYQRSFGKRKPPIRTLNVQINHMKIDMTYSHVISLLLLLLL
jgi:hypothetical protein